MYRVTIKPEFSSRPIVLHVEEIDYSFMPMVTLRGLCLPVKSSILHIENEAYEKFKDVKSLTFPYNGLCLCEELKEESAKEFAQVLSAIRQV